MPSPPETRYAKSGDLNIAYQVVGEGPIDVLYVPGWISNVELMWDEPAQAHLLQRLASFSRLILFDKRGTGLSDPVPLDRPPTLEERMDDVRAVLDAVGSSCTALFGFSEGGLMSVLFAASHPERTTALVLYGIYAKRLWSPDYPWAPTPEAREREIAGVRGALGRDDGPRHARAERGRGVQAPPGNVLPAERQPRHGRRLAARQHRDRRPRTCSRRSVCPRCVLHRTGDLDVSVEEGRWIAGQIPGAKFVELPGDDHLAWAGNADAVVDELEEFLTGVRRGREPDRVLATVLFTDIVGSTERAGELGDRRWRGAARAPRRRSSPRARALPRPRGRHRRRRLPRHLRRAGAGGPLRAGDRRAPSRSSASRSAPASTPASASSRAIDVRGIAVHIGARVAAAAGPGEVLVSSTVKDLVAGSGIEFADRGPHELKGVPGEWRLYGVVAA